MITEALTGSLFTVLSGRVYLWERLCWWILTVTLFGRKSFLEIKTMIIIIIGSFLIGTFSSVRILMFNIIN